MKCTNRMRNGHCGAMKTPPMTINGRYYPPDADLKCPYGGDMQKCLKAFLDFIVRYMDPKVCTVYDRHIQKCLNALIGYVNTKGLRVGFWQDLALNIHSERDRRLRYKELDKRLGLVKAR